MYTPAAMASDLVTLFQALGDRTRLRLLNLLAGGELCVCYFVELLREAQPKISRHLAYLRRSGLVETRRDGKWIHYRLVRPSDRRVAQICDTPLETLSQARQMQRNRAGLRRGCGRLTLSAALPVAPRP